MPRSGLGHSPAVLVAITLALWAPAVRAGWGPEGTTVRATASEIPMVAACTDGGSGTIVAWQERVNKRAGLVRVQHLLPSGDVDPAWPAEGALASPVATVRSFLDLVPDGQGGAYLLWVEVSRYPSLFVIRVDSGGQVAAGWPEEGTLLGRANVYAGRPRAIADGTHGLYVAWTSGSYVYAERFGPDGHGTGGWPDGPRVVSTIGSVAMIRLWPALALAPDGGMFVAWATQSTDTTVEASGLYLRRLTGAGANVPGWSGGGRYMTSFRPEYFVDLTQAPQLDISPDGRGGLFWFAGTLSGPDVDLRLRRLLADGHPAPGWPVEGRPVPTQLGRYLYEGTEGPDEGLRVRPDGQDGAILEERLFGAGPTRTELFRCTDDGVGSGLMTGVSGGHEVVIKGDGGAFMAGFVPHGPYEPYESNALLAVGQSRAPPGWTPWLEVHEESVPWYGDIALAPAGDDGVVFFWSQVQERQGLFARRFTTAGQVTSVPPKPGPVAAPQFRGVRFVPGAGVVARVAVGGVAARLELFDVNGRQISACTVDASEPDGADVAIPGTGLLASGLYFARLAGERSEALAKVAVVR